MLRASDLERMRLTVADSLPETATVLARTLASDGAGDYAHTWVAGTSYPARLAPLRGEELERGTRIGEESDWQITLPAGAEVSTDDRLAIGGGTYAITRLDTTRSYELSTRLIAREMED